MSHVHISHLNSAPGIPRLVPIEFDKLSFFKNGDHHRRL